jgi:hypothetical protein
MIYAVSHEVTILFVVGYVLTALTFLALGLFLLLSPGAYFALLDRMAGVDLWAKPSSSWDPKAPRWRALGVAFALFALLMIFGPPLLVYLHSPEILHAPLRSSHPGVSWGVVIVLLLFFALGVGFLVKPLAVLDRVSPRKLSIEHDVQRHTYKLRIFGGLLSLISILGMWVQFTPFPTLKNRSRLDERSTIVEPKPVSRGNSFGTKIGKEKYPDYWSRSFPTTAKKT